jgi:endo-1,4-beta-xylanase
MKSINKKNLLFSVIVIFLLTLTITTCGSGGGGGGGGGGGDDQKPPTGGGTVPAFTGFTGATLTSSSSEQETRKVSGYDYELWNQDKQGTASMTIGNGGGGTFRCNWSGIENVLFRAGKKYGSASTQTHSQIGTFSIEYNASSYNPVGNSYLSVYGWTLSPLIEYYIVDSWGSWRPPGGTSKGQVTIDEGTYDIYETTRTNQPSIQGTQTFQQYWSVRTTKKTSGTISVSQHFSAWAAKGMTGVNTGKLYEVAFKVEGFQSSGTAEINKNILRINGVPIN